MDPSCNKHAKDFWQTMLVWLTCDITLAKWWINVFNKSKIFLAKMRTNWNIFGISLLPYVPYFIVKVATLFLSDTVSFLFPLTYQLFSDLLMKNRLLHILYKKKLFSMKLKSAYLDLPVSNLWIYYKDQVSSLKLRTNPKFEQDKRAKR